MFFVITFSSKAINPFKILKVDPGGYWPVNARLTSGLFLSKTNLLYSLDLDLPLKMFGLYVGAEIRLRISPVFGSIATIAPILF